MRLSINLKNPLIKYFKNTNTKHYVEFSKKLSTNKAFEFQVSKFAPTDLINFCINLTFYGEDHAGFKFDIEVFGYFLSVQIYDTRHWDYENHKWETYD